MLLVSMLYAVWGHIAWRAAPEAPPNKCPAGTVEGMHVCWARMAGKLFRWLRAAAQSKRRMGTA